MQTLRSAALRIPAQPFDYQLPFERAALVIIDMQRDFLEPGGFGETLGNDVHAVKAIVPRVQTVLEAWRAVGGFVVHTREEHRPDLTDCPPAKRDRGSPSQRIGDHGPMGRILIAGEPGTAIVSELQPISGELVISKPGKGAFYATDLQEELKKRNISHLILIGVTTEVCVQSTMREANDRGFECLLLSDCTASFFPAFKEATLAMVTSQGAIVGWTAPSQALLAALRDER